MNDTRQKFRKMLREGKLDDKEIEIEVQSIAVGVEIMAPPGMEEMTSQLQGMFQNMSGNKSKTRLFIREHFHCFRNPELAGLALVAGCRILSGQRGIRFSENANEVFRRERFELNPDRKPAL